MREEKVLERYRMMKRVELLALAAEAGIKGRSKMTKTQLIEALSKLAVNVEPLPEMVPASASPPGHKVRPSPPVQEIMPELPGLLGKNRLVLMPQGPRTAFAYWELAGDAAMENLDLRILSVKTGEELAVYEISGRTRSYYIRLESSGAEIEALLGNRAEGLFNQILRSNRIRLPDDAPSEELPTLWMTRRKDYEEIYSLAMGGLWDKERWSSQIGYRRGYPGSSWPGIRKKDRP